MVGIGSPAAKAQGGESDLKALNQQAVSSPFRAEKTLSQSTPQSAYSPNATWQSVVPRSVPRSFGALLFYFFGPFGQSPADAAWR
jgi:hypothetical protein